MTDSPMAAPETAMVAGGSVDSGDTTTARQKEAELLCDSATSLAGYFSTREHWYQWFSSYLDGKCHGRLWALTHLSICRIEQIESTLVHLLGRDHSCSVWRRRVLDLPDRNTDWGATYADSLFAQPLRYHVVSTERGADRLVWGVLLNLAHLLLRYHDLAGETVTVSRELTAAYRKARARFPDIDPSRTPVWPHDLASRLAASVDKPTDKEVVRQLLLVQRYWHQPFAAGDWCRLRENMRPFIHALDTETGKGKSAFHIFEMATTVTVIRAAERAGWNVDKITADGGQHPRATLRRNANGRTDWCEISKDNKTLEDRSKELKKYLGIETRGFMPDIVLRFWRGNIPASRDNPCFIAFADAKRNAEAVNYVSTSIAKAIAYAASMATKNSYNAHAADFYTCAAFPVVTLFFYSANQHPDYRISTAAHTAGYQLPLVFVFELADMHAVFELSDADSSQLGTWFALFNRFLG